MKWRRLWASAAMGLVLGTGALWALADSPKEGFAPDPPVHTSDKQWVFEIKYDKGVRSIERVKSISLSKPAGSPRQMGRFAVEFWVGKELLDRVRFDVPLLGDDTGERDPKRPKKKPTFAQVTTKLKVQMADHSRATVMTFVDRASGDTQKYFWPPDENGRLTVFSAKAATAEIDAGSSDASADGSTPVATVDGSMPDATVDGSIPDATTDGSAPDATADAAQ
ncbi:MAG: hypothetical protein IPK82_05895 [Polyangiaceae bacterium]|nr:hypothetical protein [Polyangiaceae bacterium]